MALRRRPNGLFGVLIGVAGLAWFVQDWASPGAPSALLFTVGLLFGAFCPPLVGHAALSYRVGEIVRGERLGVAVGYAVAVLCVGLGQVLVLDPKGAGCATCPDNWVLGLTDTTAPVLVASTGLVLGVVSVLILVGLIVHRQIRSTSARRRVTLPVLVPAAAYL